MRGKRHYQAWLKAARKASQKTGGLSLPAKDARKAYRKMAERLDRPPMGVDVKRHPRIFKESLSIPKAKKSSQKRALPEVQPSPPPSLVRRIVVKSEEDLARFTPVGSIEYVDRKSVV